MKIKLSKMKNFIFTWGSRPYRKFFHSWQNRYSFHQEIFCIRSTWDKQHATPGWGPPSGCTGHGSESHNRCRVLLNHLQKGIEKREKEKGRKDTQICFTRSNVFELWGFTFVRKNVRFFFTFSQGATLNTWQVNNWPLTLCPNFRFLSLEVLDSCFMLLIIV